VNKDTTKILYVADCRAASGTPLSLFNEMKRRGFDIQFYNKEGSQGKHFISKNKIMPVLRSGKFTDLWLANPWVTYHSCTKRLFNNAGIYVVGFGFGDPANFYPNKARRANLYATNDFEISQRKYIDKTQVLFFPTACDLTLHKKLDVPKTTDILVYGVGKHPYLRKISRLAAARSILDMFPNKVVKIYGHRWGSLPCGGVVIGDRLVEEINKAKVSIDITDPLGQFSRRIFECGACGTVCITQDNPEVRDLFTPGKDILVYKDQSELLAQISYVLENESVRKVLQKNAYETCTTKHDISNRVDTLLAVLDEKKNHWNTLLESRRQVRHTKLVPKPVTTVQKPTRKAVQAQIKRQHQLARQKKRQQQRQKQRQKQAHQPRPEQPQSRKPRVRHTIRAQTPGKAPVVTKKTKKKLLNLTPKERAKITRDYLMRR